VLRGVDDLAVLVVIDVRRRHDALPRLLDAEDLGLRSLEPDQELLQIQHDLGHVLDDPGDRGELVLDAVDPDGRHGGPLQAGEEHPPKAVADRGAEAALEGLREELRVVGPRRRLVDQDPIGKLEVAPAHPHGLVLPPSP
jgi:hypothetical protein